MLSYSDLETMCRYRPDVEEFSVSEALGAVMAGLRDVAPVPKDDRMDEYFSSYVEGMDSALFFDGNDEDPEHPTYQYKYVIDTLLAMSSWLLSHGRLAEMACGIVIDGQDVGGAFLEKLSGPG